MTCREVRDRIAAWADDELGVEAALDVEAHLERCPTCQAAAERQRDFRTTVGALYPRPRMPETSRRALLRQLRPPRRAPRIAATALAASLAAVAAMWALRTPGLPAEVHAAVAMHEVAEHGLPPLGVTSSALPAVNRWLRDELPFAGEIAPGPASLRLAGAAAVRVGGARAAWVLYRDGAEPVSLFVLPPREWPAVGEAVHHRGIEFRTLEVGGHRVIAWNHDPVSYLLVSSIHRRPAEACAVCHVGPEAPAVAGFAMPSGS
ncbi:MAG: zf-HC2 domain-containing protein [bacterium]|nr:zf-HC2 domain-containing protein [bacterium]